MAKRIFSKRTLAIVLSLAMLLNGFQIRAMAAQNDTAPAMIQNFEDTYYKQDGTAANSSDWEIHLSKTAVVTAQENVFDITVKVQTKDTSAQLAGATNGAVMLVLDVSNSMDGKDTKCTVEGCGEEKDSPRHHAFERKRNTWNTCKHCGESSADHTDIHTYTANNKTHLQNLQAAVSEFLDTFAAGAQAGEKRMVAVAVFGTKAKTIQTWVDVTDAAARTALKNKIDSLSTGNGAYLGSEYLFNGGTNMEAGLVLARNLLKDTTALAGIPAANQSLILFSDGAPTARVDNVNSTSVTAVGYGGSDEGTKTDSVDYDDISNILKDVAVNKIAVKYNYNDTNNVLATPPFTRVITSSAATLSVDLTAEAGKIITMTTNASTVIDPMATGVTMLTVSDNYNTENKSWDLSKITPVVADGITTYTITYQVKLDSDVIAADSNYPGYTVLTPANGATVLTYTVADSTETVRADFNEPNIRGIIYYTVSYTYEGDVPAGAPQVPASATYRAGASVTVAAAPTLENYTFSGWDRADFVMPASNVVIHGQWFENLKYDYAVIYNENYGTDPETKTDSENITATYENPYEITVDENTFERQNHVFIGWATEEDGPVVYEPGDEIVFTDSGTVILYAQWVEDAKYAYSLIYNANFGKNETKTDNESVVNTYATSHSIVVDGNSFVRPNYTFVGWNTEADGSGTAYAADDVVTLTAQNPTEVLYAQWAENEKYDYRVIYNSNFDRNISKADSENLVGTYENPYEIGVDSNSFVRPNYTFIGWAKSPSGPVVYQGGDDIIFTESGTVNLYAQWVEDTKYAYSLIYNANFGGNETKADSENIGGIYDTAYAITVDPNSFVRPNYTFIGWNTERDGSGKAYAAGEKVQLTAENNTETLYAQWVEDPKYDYSVIYDANFGGNETKNDSENASRVYSTTYKIYTDSNPFNRANYTFVGWNTERDGSGKAYAAGDGIALTAENNTEILYAQWVEDPKYDYSVIYDANVGENPATKADSENVQGIYATSFSIKTDRNTFFRVNYTFIGWNTERDGSGKAYAAGDVIALTAENNTEILYAQWKENPKYDYTLIYNANFGDNETKADAENVKGIYALSYSMKADANSFRRPNYTFTGWNTKADGTGDFYAAGNEVALTAVDNWKVLYAQWVENPKYNYTVTYDANFGENATKSDAENVVGVYAISYKISVDANSFVRENYTFVGWNTERDGSGKAYAAGDAIALTAQDNTEILYAQWVENAKYDYSVFYNANFGDNETKADAENVSGTYETAYDIGVDENTFVRENYTFVGWSDSPDGEVAYNAGDNIHFVEGGSVTLYALWVENDKYNYTVIYNGNGGALEDGKLSYGDSENVVGTYEQTWDIAVDENAFIRENHTFIGWNTEADGSGKSYTAEEVIALTAEDNVRTLYAQWIENPKYDYSVSYDANFGDNETKADAENVTGIYSQTYSIEADANSFQRTGYSFVGWNTERDGSGKAYAAGDAIALTAENNTEILYAQWEIDRYAYTVNYLVRVEGEAYAPFAGDLTNAPTGETVDFGTVIDKAYLDAKGLPESLADAHNVYSFTAFEGIIVDLENNVVNVYYTAPKAEPPVEEIPDEDVPTGETPDDKVPDEDVPVEEIPDEDVPMADIPKTGDPIFVYVGMAAISGIGLICMGAKKKSEEETEE